MQRRRLFILSTGAQHWHTQDFLMGWGANRGEWSVGLEIFVVNSLFLRILTTFINYTVYHGR